MRKLALVVIVALAACRDAPPAPTASPTLAPSESGDAAAVASSASAAASASPTAVPAERLQALGTEPFWSVEITGEQLRYSTPENQAGTAFAAKRTSEGPARVWSGTLEGKSFVLRIAAGTCSDGMSDTVYPWTAQVAFGDTTLSGCARTR